MTHLDIGKQFAASFKHASGQSPAVFSSGIRFLAIMLVIIASIWVINHFMDEKQRHREDFLIVMGSRLIRIAISLTVFVLLLTTRGD